MAGQVFEVLRPIDERLRVLQHIQILLSLWSPGASCVLLLYPAP